MGKPVVCAVDGCSTVASRKGWCDKHYRRWLRRGGVDVVLPHGRVRGTCAVAECDRPHASRGLCDMHYRRFLTHGDPALGAFALNPEGSKRWDGYRVKSVKGKQRQVHTLVAEQALGKPLPPDAVVHHVDEDRSNNAANNLVICPDRAYHAALHKRMRQLNWSVR